MEGHNGVPVKVKQVRPQRERPFVGMVDPGAVPVRGCLEAEPHDVGMQHEVQHNLGREGWFHVLHDLRAHGDVKLRTWLLLIGGRSDGCRRRIALGIVWFCLASFGFHLRAIYMHY